MTQDDGDSGKDYILSPREIEMLRMYREMSPTYQLFSRALVHWLADGTPGIAGVDPDEGIPDDLCRRILGYPAWDELTPDDRELFKRLAAMVIKGVREPGADGEEKESL